MIKYIHLTQHFPVSASSTSHLDISSSVITKVRRHFFVFCVEKSNFLSLFPTTSAATAQKMPKKISTNSKALEARERKADAKKVATDRAAKDAEDRLWQDDDKNLAKKKSKKEEEERKRAELLRKKAENKELLEKEVAAIRVAAKPSIQKVTQAQIAAETEKRNRVVESINTSAKAPVRQPRIFFSSN